MVDYPYDIETYPNCFTLVIGNSETRKCSIFEISFRKDQRKQMFEYLRNIKRTKGRMVGYNNIGFDYPVIHYILKNQDCTVQDIYSKAMSIINSESKFEHLIRPKDILIPQLDLYKIHHFDNKARATSLKMLEFNMMSDNIEDLPFPVGKVLTSSEIDTLIKYNKHDMVQTFEFYLETDSQIKFREELTKKYNRDFMNHNDTKIGKDFFVMRLEEEIPGSCYTKGKVRQTKRSYIDLKECIFDYVKFDRIEFKEVQGWLSRQRITETKGVFTDIMEHELGELAKYSEMKTKRKKLFKKPTESQVAGYKKDKPMCWVQEEQLKSGKISYWLCWNVAETLNVVIDGFRYDFGTGGIHGSIESGIVRSDDEWIINDQDVASFYPNLAIKNRIYPEHLGESFCDIYEDVYNQRKQLKKEGKESEQAMMKLALNGTYGASNDQYSPFFDPKFTMSITINGQLSLCMLAEKLLEIPTLSMIQVNTDGLTYKVKRKYYQQALNVCKQWQIITNLELEGVEYKNMFIRDVNNYISEKYSGELKNKGAYQWDGLGWHQNHSSKVIAMAAEEYLVRGENLEEFICNHNNKYDFMLRTKVPRSSRLVQVIDGQDVPLQNICRYYITYNGGELVKVMPPVHPTKEMKVFIDELGQEWLTDKKPEIEKYTKKGWKLDGVRDVPCDDRRIGINTGWNVSVCNDIKDFRWDINYDYYIDEAKKLVDLPEVLND